ncbi:DUF952 domain-containing protein [Sphingomonas sp. R-74633]|uniref:DUF952 domain-containing protein n=1 Tax=Sphingomonas sp. R-74633 TaxID=2751188 RepID=UPI0015D3149F|nr:DUF952 domain-containing protein [Sphingomonas sp. R-74633]NYT39808.1 DUF952 domain-containing protein [Sphingomonas sp. R-74633]
MSETPNTAYKILTAEQMHALEHEGVFAGAPIDLQDGYIHLSTAQQLVETLDKHFAGQTGLWLAAVDLEAMADAVRWEPSRGGQLFPHLYAPLPLDAVTAYSEVHYEPNGALRLPVAG